MGTSNFITLVALMNAMIGGTILVLPLLFLSAGLIPAIIVTVLSGAINYWSCKLCYDHLRDDPDLPVSVLRHTRNPIYPRLYDLLVWLSLQLILLLYFNLIVKQWQAVLLKRSFWIAIANAVACFLLVVLMGRCKMAVNLLGYGILSIAAYVVFIGWLLWSAPASGNKQYPLATWNFAELCDTLATAFSLQGIFIPILRKNENVASNGLMLLLAYLLGGLVYGYIGLAGSYGILNRVAAIASPETVEDFFSEREWPVTTIALIYLFHLYSVFPEYLLISKKRFFSLVGWEDKEVEGARDLAHIAVTTCVCVIVCLSGLSLRTILALNGSIFGFLFIYFLPIALHVKCMFFPEKQQDSLTYEMIFHEENEQTVDRVALPPTNLECNIPKDSATRTLHIVLMALMWMAGIFVLSYSLLELFRKLTK